MCRRLLILRTLAPLLFLAASPTAPAAEPAQQVEQVAPGRVVPIELNVPVPPEAGGEWVLLPVPDSNPSVGTGLRLVGAHFFRADAVSQTSVLGAAAGYYDSRTRFAGLGGNINMLEDRWRIAAGIGVVEVNYDFYGVGTDAGGNSIRFPIQQNGTAGFIKVLHRIGSNFYLGAGYRYLDSRVGLRVSGAVLPPEIDEILGQGVRLVSAGPILTASYDTRDLNTNPRSGSFIAFEAIFPRERLFSSDQNYQRVTFNANHYLSLGQRYTLGTRLTLCGASDGTPFFDLCLFGSNGDLRGYAVGQYQDRSMFALQAELRAQLLPRWGGVVFAGAGQVAPDFGAMKSNNLLTSVGFGVRWLAAQKSKVNLRVDVAWREGGESAVYVSIGEAF